MESRLIYESGKTYLSKVNWLKLPRADSEWNHLNSFCLADMERLIKDFFHTDILHVLIGRASSFSVELSVAAKSIEPHLNVIDFIIWSADYKKAMQFSNIGVYRSGLIKSGN